MRRVLAGHWGGTPDWGGRLLVTLGALVVVTFTAGLVLVLTGAGHAAYDRIRCHPHQERQLDHFETAVRAAVPDVTVRQRHNNCGAGYDAELVVVAPSSMSLHDVGVALAHSRFAGGALGPWVEPDGVELSLGREDTRPLDQRRVQISITQHGADLGD